jgi:hypothetical protein
VSQKLVAITQVAQAGSQRTAAPKTSIFGAVAGTKTLFVVCFLTGSFGNSGTGRGHECCDLDRRTAWASAFIQKRKISKRWVMVITRKEWGERRELADPKLGRMV